MLYKGLLHLLDGRFVASSICFCGLLFWAFWNLAQFYIFICFYCDLHFTYKKVIWTVLYFYYLLIVYELASSKSTLSSKRRRTLCCFSGKVNGSIQLWYLLYGSWTFQVMCTGVDNFWISIWWYFSHFQYWNLYQCCYLGKDFGFCEMTFLDSGEYPVPSNFLFCELLQTCDSFLLTGIPIEEWGSEVFRSVCFCC